jgi:hypothetical protein
VRRPRPRARVVGVSRAGYTAPTCGFPADAPSAGRRVVLHLRVRRFFCPDALACRSRLVGAERSPTRETPGRAGSSADKAGTAWNCQTGWVRRARSEGIREESVVKLRKRGTASNLVDMGRVAVHSLLVGRADFVADLACRWGGHGESLRRNRGDAAGAKLDAGLIDRFTVNTGTIPYRSLGPVSIRVRGLDTSSVEGAGWGGGPVVVRADERSAHGEGGQQVSSTDTGMPGGRLPQGL